MFDITRPTPLTEIDHPLFVKKNISVSIKRDDQIDLEISGNKWRKLKYNLLNARSLGYEHILTFGGAYSNHISATAAACHRFGFGAIGIIRGDELNENSNSTLKFAHGKGMNLQFVSRARYRDRVDSNWLDKLSEKYNAFVIPEGGTNEFALKGVAELVDEIDIAFDYILCPVGTGGTLAGIASALDPHQSVMGISCLKGADFLTKDISELIDTDTNWQLNHDYHFGGYGKHDGRLIEFINEFKAITGIPLDPVYTGKMMYAIVDLVKKDKFESGSRLICIHTGGLQGIAGFNEKYNNILKS